MDYEDLRKKAFALAVPELPRQEMQAARDANKLTISLRVAPFRVVDGKVELVAVKFVLADQATPVLLLDPVAAGALGELLSRLDAQGFRADSVVPKGTPH